jgi:hypothetical protein
MMRVSVAIEALRGDDAGIDAAARRVGDDLSPTLAAALGRAARRLAALRRAFAVAAVAANSASEAVSTIDKTI